MDIIPSGIRSVEKGRNDQNFGDHKYNILYRGKFFMSKNELKHKKVTWDLLDFLSEIGGLISVMILIIGVLGAENANMQFLTRKIIRNLYIHRIIPEDKEHEKN